ncbi:phosphate regulon sensor histidine kinase PhoR [Oceanisphaera pacifica]|uniref:Phosphate regulon sensor protein PhoR n=1 Tax=Oceanisphaera pacifica TaxID=2818389 RepID=A0ABS3NHG8_9GAMM|nr:phosphate regulon sensor histidine kinase PhoR [Oceanisphaera pacifica]MBO1520011.1 phosphate regulon sensor histidine kinase PhoR [Oceanisphaera pacifica]
MQLHESRRGLWWRLALFYSCFLVLGLVITNISLGLLCATVLHLLWHYRFQHKLKVWLWRERSLIPPHGKGSWESIFNGLYRQQQRQRARRRELARLIKRFRQGAEALPDAAVVIRHDGSIIWCNKLAQQLLGFRWPDDAGQHIGNLIRTPLFIAYMEQGDFLEPLELPAPQCEQTLLECRVMHYIEDQLLLVVRDVTRLRGLEQVRKTFVANVSHELRTPLTVLKGYLELLEDTPEPAMWQKTQTVMLEQTLRMEALVQQLMTLTRIEAAGTEDVHQAVDMPSILTMLEQEAQALSGDRQHLLHFEVDTQLKVQGCEDQLRSVVSNLVYNAIRHTADGSAITVEWRCLDKGAYFSVTDTGEGISPKHLARLTERFYRVDKARSRQTGGSGLGLAIVKHALAHHGAQLDISSKLGQGSCFSFILPAHRLISAPKMAK